MYLGLDLGTSSLKGLLIDQQQRLVGSASAALEIMRPAAGWSEQDPADWIAACEKVLDQLVANYPGQMSALCAIGLSGQMHGATLVDEAGNPLRPSILWNDTRSHKEAAELDADPDFRAISGNIVFPGFTAPKLVWVKRHEPEIFKKTKKILLPKDYLRLWLTGEYICDMSDASGTSWLDVKKRDWSDILLEKTGLSRTNMPALVEGSAPGGMLRQKLAQRWGVGANVIVAGGAGDNAAAAIGMGVINSGMAFVSLGTSGVLFAATDKCRPAPQTAVHSFCHALPARWHQMGVILAATDALNWFSRIAGHNVQTLVDELGENLKTPSGPLFLPYLGGERTPYNDAEVRGAFFGLSHNDDRAAMTRAVMEGVGFALRDNLQALSAAGTEISRLLAVGGGAKSRYWLKTIASILGLEVDVPREGDFGAAFGAARLGLMAASGLKPEQVCTPPEISETIGPDKLLTAAFSERYEAYKAAYPRLCLLKGN
ncbi:Xylulose kinase [hydrothermal vent metagenome]|uniref:Xylulose kinase n=1 Tax=hydrothermal vent metagenome TaxID=652676 RepID=A0A3B0TRK9_9ZZZZ